MPRLRSPVMITLSLCACTAPGLKDFEQNLTPASAAESSGSSSSGGASDGSTSVMTSSSGSGSASEGWGSTTGTSAMSTTAGESSDTGEPGSTGGTSSTGSEAVCGDEIVEGEEECDDPLDPACVECRRDRWVFVTAATHESANFGDLASVDDFCKQYAFKSGKAGDRWITFIAWLSDSNNDVKDRLYRGRGRYVRTDGVVVALDVDQFFSGTLEAPISVDEYGEPATGRVVTGTMPDGTRAPGDHCKDWTSESIFDLSAYTGNAESSGSDWTMHPDPQVNPTSCFALHTRLYCIEGK